MEPVPQPRMTVLAGPNGSGKSTVTRGLMQSEEFPRDRYVNADDIARTLENPILDADTRRRYAETIAPNMPELPMLGKIWYMGSRMSEEQIATELERGVGNTDMRNAFAAILADDQRKQYVSAPVREDFAFETVMSTQGKMALFDEARQNGFQVDMIFVTTQDPIINQQRVLNRVAEGGHSVDPAKIAERYHRAMDMLPEALLRVDSASVYDNSAEKPVLIARKVDGRIEFPEIDMAKMGTSGGTLGQWFDATMATGLQDGIRQRVEALQKDFGELQGIADNAGKPIVRAGVNEGSESIGRVVRITDEHVMQFDYEAQRFIVHDKSLLSRGMVPKLEEAMRTEAPVNIAYHYGPDSKLTDQAKSLDRTPLIGERELNDYMMDPNRRESPNPNVR